MWGVLLIALIIYAVVQHRKRKRLRWMKYGNGGDWSDYGRSRDRGWAPRADAKASTTASAERFANDLHSKIKREFDGKLARKFEAKAERFERKLRARFDRQT